MSHTLNLFRRAAAVLALAALGACTLMPERVPVGATRADVESRLGAPTSVHALERGQRLQYSGQPAGQWVYNVDLDAQGRVEQVTQALDEDRFRAELMVDRWSRPQVLQQFGRPAVVERTAFFDGEIWTYRYDRVGSPRRLHLHLDPSGTVRRLVTTDELREAEPRFLP